MIEISFLTGMILVTVAWILFRAIAILKSKTFSWKYEATQLFMLINLLVIARFVFYPFSKIDGQVQPLIFDISTAFPFRINLIPFVNLLDYDTAFDLVLNLTGNFAMFIPTGIVVPLIYKKINTFPKVLLTGALISLTIEIIQLPFAVRASDVDDLILNTAGCIVGYSIYALCRRIKVKKTTAKK